MPLIKEKSSKVISKNIAELNTSKPSAPREKAIHTYMSRHNVDYGTAKNKLSVAIAIANSKRS